jgi:TetR/AcrR family transcriptional regulator, transcriptional repressor of aconitase
MLLTKANEHSLLSVRVNSLSRTNVLFYCGFVPKISEEYRTARRSEIARAALRCFARKGFDGTSMADIIAESGLSAGAIYGHYKSKNELIQLTVAELLEGRFDDLSGVLSAERLVPPGELIGLFLRGVQSELGDVGILVQLWAAAVRDAELRRMASGIAAKIQGMFIRYLTAWHEQEGMSASEAQDRAARESAICIGIAQGYIVQAAILDDFDGNAYIASVQLVFR